MYYAEIDENGKCFAVSNMKPIYKPTLIPLYGNEKPLGKIWNGLEWTEDKTKAKKESIYTEIELMDAYREGIESVG